MVPNLEHIHKYADKDYILVVDDANFDGVIDKIKEFTKDKNVIWDRTIRTETSEDANDFWNGVYICVIENDYSKDNYLPEEEFTHLYKMMMSYNALESSKIVDDTPENVNQHADGTFLL